MALVDDADYEWLSAHKWCASYPNTYALRRLPRSEGGHIVWMHKVILGASRGIEVDHIDGNPLNNQRSNLRLATHRENSFNTKRPTTNKSGFKGVYWHKAAGKWAACITIHDKAKHLGLFVDIDDAAKAYELAARANFGAFARLC